MRAIAILLVFCEHASLPGFVGGWLGVEVFFVLSGYLITTLLLNEYRAFGSISLRRFYTRRVLRLWPALLVMLAVMIPFHNTGLGFGPSVGRYFVHGVLASGLYYEDIAVAFFNAPTTFVGHTFSLAIEEQFYLCWPPLLVFCLRRNVWAAVSVLVALIALSLALTATHHAAPSTTYIGYYYSPVSQAFPLLVGCLLAVARTEGALHRLKAGWGTLLSLLGCLGLAAMMVTTAHYDRTHWFWLQLVLITGSTVVLVLGLDVNEQSLVARILAWKPLATLGLISYGFYLWHIPVILSISPGPTGGTYTRAIGWFVVSLALAIASYYAVELRFLRIKARYSSNVPAIATPDPISVPEEQRAAPDHPINVTGRAVLEAELPE